MSLYRHEEEIRDRVIAHITRIVEEKGYDDVDVDSIKTTFIDHDILEEDYGSGSQYYEVLYVDLEGIVFCTRDNHTYQVDFKDKVTRNCAMHDDSVEVIHDSEIVKETKFMNKEEILDTIRTLASSQGHYSRLYSQLMGMSAEDRDEILSNLEMEMLPDAVSLVIYLEN